MKKRITTKTLESREQTKLFEFASHFNELKWMFAIPNGGYRNPREAANLKRQGVKAGVSDIFLPLPTNKYHGLFIEMKVHPNKPSEKQKIFISNMLKNGYSCKVCYSSEDAVKEINNYIGRKIWEKS